jgi:hypothetical protein
MAYAEPQTERGPGIQERRAFMSNHHPYRALPAYTRWSKAVAAPSYAEVDPAVRFPFRITSDQKVATGGSCFAQHIARHLAQNGFNYYVVEDGHPLGWPSLKESFNYGTYSARYGNLYTARQLLQLMRRCIGQFVPDESIWPGEAGFIDPFRPAIQPDGFTSRQELLADRAQHLGAVRRMFETLDVFVFTLGLTEYWHAKSDGAAFPVCPGVAGGTFDEARYGFANQSVFEVVGDMSEFLALLSGLNPRAKVVLTVSPVPLVATAEDRHVLVSTTVSKAILRAACDELVRRHDHVAYFPSYEVITGAFNRGRYFAEDLRSVTEEGVGHVMRLFLKHAAGTEAAGAAPEAAPPAEGDFLARMQKVVATACEEELIEVSYEASTPA